MGKVKSLARPAAAGIGGAILATMVAGVVAPQFANNPITRVGGAFLLGGPIGAATEVVTSGMLGNIGGLLGGVSGGNGDW